MLLGLRIRNSILIFFTKNRNDDDSPYFFNFHFRNYFKIIGKKTRSAYSTLTHKYQTQKYHRNKINVNKFIRVTTVMKNRCFKLIVYTKEVEKGIFYFLGVKFIFWIKMVAIYKFSNNKKSGKSDHSTKSSTWLPMSNINIKKNTNRFENLCLSSL